MNAGYWYYFYGAVDYGGQRYYANVYFSNLANAATSGQSEWTISGTLAYDGSTVISGTTTAFYIGGYIGTWGFCGTCSDVIFLANTFIGDGYDVYFRNGLSG